MSHILVISPHPDDEAIGCGGTLRKHVLAGDRVHVVFLTSGEKGGHGRSPEKTRQVQEREARKAADILGLAQIEFWGATDGAVQATPELVRRLRRTLSTWRPARLYVTHPREMHPDHRASARLVRKALQGRTKVPAVLLYEVWTPLQQLDEIVDITAHLSTKLAAIRAYRSQCATLAFDKAIMGLNRYRGEMHSWPEGEYAEVFTRLRL
jgi:LmbE family N-acetylglucosaminyl deacetylase